MTAAAIVSLALSFLTVQAEGSEGLRAELSLERSVFYPTQAIHVRFTLFNGSEQPVRLPKGPIGAGGVSLPRGVILGYEQRPALWISFENEAPTPVAAAEYEQSDAAGAITLAPKGALGADLTLNDFYRHIRYSGRYRLEWRPLDDSVAPATATFMVETRKDAVLVTDHGKITFALNYDKAPLNVENFLDLVREKFYDRKTIHRIIPGFIIQGGSPDGTSKGVHPDGRLVKGEFSDAQFDLGTLAMARKPSDPDSASCQFFITLGRLPNLDGEFTAIGRVRDEESLRTLRVLSDLPTDDKHRPIRPLSIRFMTLVDLPDYSTEDLNMP